MQKFNLSLILTALALSVSVHAQITVTNTAFPVVGDTYNYNIDVNPVIPGFFTPPGFNQTWDFSNLQTDLTSATIFNAPNTGAHSASFPGADLLVNANGREMYYDVNNSLNGGFVKLMGYFGSDPINIGINLLVPYAPPLGVRRSPVNMFDVSAVSSGVLVPFDDVLMPANLRQLLPVMADSFRIRVAINRIDAVDAWGTLSIPGGCYQVLREKRTAYTEQRLDAKVPPLGWLDITDIAIQTLGLTELGVDTTVEHHFFSNVSKQEIAILRLNNAQSAVEMAWFKAGGNVQLAITNIATTPEICPNANNGSITVTATGTSTLTYSISGPSNQSNGTGVFTGLPDGSYTVTVTSNSSPCPASAMAFVAAGVDGAPPTATCTNTTLVFNGQQSITLNTGELVTATDNCGVQSITLSPATILATQVGQPVLVTATVLDVNGNSATCVSTVTVSGLPAGWSEPPPTGCTNCTSDFSYSPGTDTWTGSATGAVYNSPYNADAAAFAARMLCGSGSITARVTGIDGSGWAGVVMRESNAAGAKKAQLMTNLTQFSRREFRTVTNGQAFPQQFPNKQRYWLRIVREGHQFTLFASPNEADWFLVGAQNIVMSNCIQMGLVATNASATETVTATFSNVAFTGASAASAMPGGGPATHTDLSSQHEADFSVFPNPTSGELNVDLTQYIGREVRIEVYSLEGRLMQFSEIDEVQTDVQLLNLAGFHSGMYLIKVKSNGLPDVTRRVMLAR
ncbi:MAG: T9SS type A sorting domain-containing protein [Saprospiraceae bacterium]|nr:T9SS type A sorting domain-containing protein [Saprospiraceae bacterium]